MQGDRLLTASFDGGTLNLNLFRGALIGCYTCHNGPDNDSINNSTPPAVNVVSGSTPNSAPLRLPVTVTPSSATLRIISQPASGSLGVSNNVLTYFPDAGFVGSATFTYAAWDGSKNSTLATGTVSVVQGPASLTIAAQVPTSAPAAWPAPFNVFATPVNTLAPVGFNWNFGDGSAAGTNQFATHVFAAPGIYSWQVVATVGTASATNAGSINITAPVALAVTPPRNSSLNLSWPTSLAEVIVEQSDTLDSAAKWTAVTNLPVLGPSSSSVNLPVGGGNRFFRVRQSW